ncbi:hypothetical protein FT641_17975 [Bacillus paranthracis]|uniref:hypothetical protein n=1 Tax=Bacillus paranthracis TaxID=2026186 RepID=UPI00187905A3|nr:hypothetical protein [Bacillus paranthracis]MBE7114550.1 hypothetical protein [Bacillus paranthracis]MBE7154576.1 hypothetical protein [Bacillus paranthracis]
MGFFDDKEKMFVPLSIDNVDTERNSYFASNKKMVGVFFAILPYVGLLSIFMKLGAGIIPIIVMTGIYLFIFSFFIRYWVFEEVRLRKMIQEKDDNVISGVSHFWGTDKVGSGERDDGLIYYQREGAKLKRGLVVYFDRRSNVGVPEGHYEQYRKTKNEFLRELYARGMDFQWYEVQRKPEMSKTLTRYADILNDEPREAMRMLAKLQLNINSMYTMDAEQRYVDYIVVTNTRFVTMKRFKKMLNDILTLTLRSNGYLGDVKICSKEEVDKFYETIYMLNSFNSSYIRKSVDMQPFNKFAKLKRLIGEDGQAIPIELLDELELSTGGKSLEEISQAEERKEKSIESVRLKQYKNELETAKKIRMANEITTDEYDKLVAEIEYKYSPDNYEPNLDKKKREQARADELEKRQRIKAEREALKKEDVPDTNWHQHKQDMEVIVVKDTEPNKVDNPDVFGDYDDDDEDLESFNK